METRIPDRFIKGVIAGVEGKSLESCRDDRGWLMELFRKDEGFTPRMAYVSMTLPGVARGPHEHAEQTDCFVFVGPSDFMLHLWDVRPSSPSYGIYECGLSIGECRPLKVLIPPGIVHAYRNIGKVPGLVYNFPDRLYKGWQRQQTVDEIRHEGDPRFVME